MAAPLGKGKLEQALLAAGERVLRVPPHRMGASRRGERERERGKSDQIDSLAVARAVVNDGVEKFPVAFLDEQAMEIRLLSDHRHDLVVERTRTINRLRWHLVVLCLELEASLKKRSLDQTRVLARVDRRLRRMPPGARVSVARDQVSQIRGLTRQVNALESELAALVMAHRPQLLARDGLRRGDRGDPDRPDRRRRAIPLRRKLRASVRHPPIKCSSGQHDRHRLNRGGDRQPNHALHIVVITRAQRDPTTKEYLARKKPKAKRRRERFAA